MTGRSAACRTGCTHLLIRKLLGSNMCRSEQVLPPDAFGSLVHCLAASGDDLWCALGSGTLVVYSLASREIRIKVQLSC